MAHVDAPRRDAARRPAEPLGHAHAGGDGAAGRRRARPHRLQRDRLRRQLLHGGAASSTAARTPGKGSTCCAARSTARRCAAACAATPASPSASRPDALMDLWMRRLNEHGVRSFWIYDVLYGIDNFARLARIAKEYGSEVVGTRLLHDLAGPHGRVPGRAKRPRSPRCRRSTASSSTTPPACSTSSGCARCCRRSSPRRRRKPVEIHANNLMGTSGLTYVEAVKHGVQRSCTRPAALDGQRALGALDRERRPQPRADGRRARASTPRCWRRSTSTSARVGRAAGYLVDQVSEYDLFNVTHQVPGRDGRHAARRSSSSTG